MSTAPNLTTRNRTPTVFPVNADMSGLMRKCEKNEKLLVQILTYLLEKKWLNDLLELEASNQLMSFG